ncbi:hypothetical protein ACWEN3_02015 [Streptomyces sp. NPDC004561]
MKRWSGNAVTGADDALQGIDLIGKLAIVTGGYSGGFADMASGGAAYAVD